MKISLIFTVMTFFISSLTGQVNFTGSWKGILTQNEGGYRSEYKFEIYLIQEGDDLTGRTYVSVDNIYAELKIVGKVINGEIIQFQETEFVQFTELDNLEWCYKVGQLQLKKVGRTLRLEGRWEGFTDFGRCIPGQLFLTKQVPKA